MIRLRVDKLEEFWCLEENRMVIRIGMLLRSDIVMMENSEKMIKLCFFLVKV